MLRGLCVSQLETGFPIFRVIHITISVECLKYTEASKSQSALLSSSVIFVGVQTLKSIALKKEM